MFKKLYSRKAPKNIVEGYVNYLLGKGSSKTTIKNYLTDIKQFIIWRESNSSLVDSEETVNLFSKDMSKFFTPSSVQRKVSSIKKFLKFENEEKEVAPKNQFSYRPWVASLVILILAILISPKQSGDFIKPTAQERIVNIPNSVTISYSDPSVIGFEAPKGITISLPTEPIPSSSTEDMLISNNFREAQVLEEKGTGTISKGETESLVRNSLISPSSFVYITPQGTTNNQVLYLKTIDEGYMVIAVDESAQANINYFWKLDNTEVYRSIF